MSKSENNLESLPAEAFFSIVSSEVFVWDALQEALQAAGSPVGVGRFMPLHILARLAHAKESAMSRLVERMVVERMVKDGLVSQERDGADRRDHVRLEGTHSFGKLVVLNE